MCIIIIILIMICYLYALLFNSLLQHCKNSLAVPTNQLVTSVAFQFNNMPFTPLLLNSGVEEEECFKLEYCYSQ